MQQMRWFEETETPEQTPVKPTARSEVVPRHLSRWVCIYLHELGLDVLCPKSGREDKVLVLVDDQQKGQVALCNTKAKQRGIRPGMTLSAAYALSNDLMVKRRNPQEEAKVLELLAAWAMRFTSMVSLLSPNALLLEIKGSERLFGGVDCLKTLIETDFQQLGYQASMALAPTPTAAWILARAHDTGVFVETDAGNLAGCLSTIDVGLCGFDTKTVESLRSAGLHQFSDCFRLPRDGLARRMGPDIVHFIDQALGKVADPRQPFAMPSRFERSMALPSATLTTDALLFCTDHLLSELAAMLRASAKAVSKLTLTLSYQRHPPTVMIISLLTPTRDAQHIQSLFKERLERTTIPEPVESLRLSVDSFTSLSPGSLDFFRSVTASSEGWQRLVDRIRTRLGDKALYGLGVCDEYRPERAWTTKNPTEVRRDGEAPRATRPVWLLPEPVPIKTRQGNPVIRGVLKLSAQCERIESGWWDGHDVARDYFVGQNQTGERFWVFRDCRSKNNWYVQGVFS